MRSFGVVQRRFMSTSSRGQVQELLRKEDRNSFVGGLLLPSEDARRGYFAVRLMNSQVSRVWEASGKNDATAKLRYQWWRDLVEFAYSGQGNNFGVESHPVAHELRFAVDKFGLTRRWLDRMIDAREDDRFVQHVETMEAMEMYCENTASSIMYLLLEMLGVRDSTADHCASHVGKAIGLATILNGFPYLYATGQIRIPKDVMAQYNLKQLAFIGLAQEAMRSHFSSSSSTPSKEEEKGEQIKPGRLDPTPKPTGKKDDFTISMNPRDPAFVFGSTRDKQQQKPVESRKIEPEREQELVQAHSAMVECIFHVASVAHGHLGHAQEMQKQLAPKAIPAFTSTTVPTKLFLTRLERTAKFDIFDPKLRNDPLFPLKLQFHLLKNKLTKSF